MLQATHHTLLANRRSLRTSDLDFARDHLSKLLWPHRLKLGDATRAFNFEHNVANCGSVTLNALRYGREIEISATPTDFVYLVKFTLAGSCEVRQNNSVVVSSANAVCVMNPNYPVNVRLSHDHNQVTLRVNGDRLHRFLHSNLGYQATVPLEFFPVSTLWKRNAPGLARLIKVMCDDFSEPKSGFISKTVAPHLEDAIYGLLLDELPHNFSEQVHKPHHIDTRCLKLACEFIDAHAKHDVRLFEIANAAETNVRYLQKAFRQHLKTTPTGYLRDRRLEYARQELIEHRDRSITEVALANGFTHFGRFTQYYRAKYGETPKATRN